MYLTFLNEKRRNQTQVTINGNIIPYQNKAKYLGKRLDIKLKWKEHDKKKREVL